MAVSDRRGADRLVDHQVGDGGDLRRFGVLVVQRDRIRFVAGHSRGVVEGCRCGGVDSHGDGDGGGRIIGEIAERSRERAVCDRNTPLGCRRRDERHTGWERIGNADSGGVRGTVVGDDHRVGQQVPGGDGIDVVGLHDGEISPADDDGRFGVGIVRRNWIRFVAGDGCGVVEVRGCGRIHSHGDGDCRGRIVGEIAERSTERAVREGDASLSGRRGNEGDTGGERIGDSNAGCVGWTVVGASSRQ